MMSLFLYGAHCVEAEGCGSVGRKVQGICPRNCTFSNVCGPCKSRFTTFWVPTADLKVCLKARGVFLNPWTCHGMGGLRHVSATYRGRLSVKSMMSSS